MLSPYFNKSPLRKFLPFSVSNEMIGPWVSFEGGPRVNFIPVTEPKACKLLLSVTLNLKVAGFFE